MARVPVFGAAARFSRSLIASPRPSCGTFITAMVLAPEASSARRCENRLAAASIEIAARRKIKRPASGAAPKASSASPSRAASGVEPQPCLGRVMRGQHARRQRRVGVGRRLDQACGRARARCRRAPGRRGAAASGSPRQRNDGRIRRRRRRGRRRSPCRCGRADRRAHAPASSARRGRSGWPTAPPPVRRRPRAAHARPGAPARARAIVSSPASARSATPQCGCFGSTRVSGPGQKAAASFSAVGVEVGEAARRRGIGDMRDQRVEGRPALGGVEPGDGLAIAGIGAEAVDGLGRKRDQPAWPQAARRRRNACGIVLHHARSRLGGHRFPQACSFRRAGL